MEKNQILDHAKKIEKTTFTYNMGDYLLLKQITCSTVYHKNKHIFFANVIDKLNQDAGAYQALLTALLKQPDYNVNYYPLKSSLQKLLGLNALNNKVAPGIIDCSIDVLANDKLDVENGLINQAIPTQNLLTLYKYICIHLIVVHNNHNNLSDHPSFNTKLKLLYCIQLHTKFAAIVQDTGLFSTLNKTHFLNIPNSGYIFGGKLQNTKKNQLHSGLDCSGYVFLASHYINQKSNYDRHIIPSTIDVEKSFYHAKSIDSTITPSNEQQMFINERYDFISKDELSAGDIIVWRIFREKDHYFYGHTAIFARWKSKQKDTCMVYEAIRLDDCTKEGIIYTFSQLNIEHAVAYFLRKKS